MTGSVRNSPSLHPPRNPEARAIDVLLHGPRTHLRELRVDDGQAFVAAAHASRALHGAWVYPPATVEDFVARMKKRNVAANSVSTLLVRSSDRAIVGHFNLSEIIRGPLQQAFLGYYAFAPHEGAGYMREGMKLLLEHAFRTLKLHRVEANIQPGNDRSIALARASGFVREGFSERYLKIGGRWRDHERWAINADAWRTSSPGRAVGNR